MACVCTDRVAIVGVEYMEATETVAMHAFNKFFVAISSTCVSNIFVNLKMDLLYILVPSRRLISHRDVSLVGDSLDTPCCPQLSKNKTRKQVIMFRFVFHSLFSVLNFQARGASRYNDCFEIETE